MRIREVNTKKSLLFWLFLTVLVRQATSLATSGDETLINEGFLSDDIEITDRIQRPLDEPEEDFMYRQPDLSNYTVQDSSTPSQKKIVSTQKIDNMDADKKTEEPERGVIRRLLQQIVDQSFFAFNTLPQFIQISTILIIAAAVSNSFELLMPLIEYTQMFYFLGFMNIQKGPMDTFYTNFYASKMDPYRLIGSSLKFMVFTPPAGMPSPVVKAGIIPSILSNLVPDLVLILVATLIYVITKILAVLIKNEMVRKINFAFKSIWNGLVYVECLRFAFYIGLQARFIQTSNLSGIIEIVLLSLVGAVLIGYPIKLAFEIKAFVEDQENNQILSSIGLIENIDHQKIFEFDCLRYSNMYYPIMNYVRHLIFFASLGASFDFTKIQIGGTIVSLFLFYTIFFNEPPYKRRKDNFMIFFSNAFILITICIMIAVDITETISYSHVSKTMSLIILGLYLTGLSLHVLNIIASIVMKIIERRKENQEKKDEQTEKESQFDKTEKVYKKGDNSENQKVLSGTNTHSEQEESLEEDKENVPSNPKLKIKKVKNARIL